MDSSSSGSKQCLKVFLYDYGTLRRGLPKF